MNRIDLDDGTPLSSTLLIPRPQDKFNGKAKKGRDGNAFTYGDPISAIRTQSPTFGLKLWVY